MQSSKNNRMSTVRQYTTTITVHAPTSPESRDSSRHTQTDNPRGNKNRRYNNRNKKAAKGDDSKKQSPQDDSRRKPPAKVVASPAPVDKEFPREKGKERLKTTKEPEDTIPTSQLSSLSGDQDKSDDLNEIWLRKPTDVEKRNLWTRYMDYQIHNDALNEKDRESSDAVLRRAILDTVVPAHPPPEYVPEPSGARSPTTNASDSRLADTPNPSKPKEKGESSGEAETTTGTEVQKRTMTS